MKARFDWFGKDLFEPVDVFGDVTTDRSHQWSFMSSDCFQHEGSVRFLGKIKNKYQTIQVVTRILLVATGRITQSYLFCLCSEMTSVVCVKGYCSLENL